MQHKTKVDYTFVRKYCKDVVAKEYSYEERGNLLLHVFEALKSCQLSEDHAVFALRIIVNPVLCSLTEEEDVNTPIMSRLVSMFVEIVKLTENQSKILERGELLPNGVIPSKKLRLTWCLNCIHQTFALKWSC